MTLGPFCTLYSLAFPRDIIYDTELGTTLFSLAVRLIFNIYGTFSYGFVCFHQ